MPMFLLTYRTFGDVHVLLLLLDQTKNSVQCSQLERNTCLDTTVNSLFVIPCNVVQEIIYPLILIKVAVNRPLVFKDSHSIIIAVVLAAT